MKDSINNTEKVISHYIYPQWGIDPYGSPPEEWTGKSYKLLGWLPFGLCLPVYKETNNG